MKLFQNKLIKIGLLAAFVLVLASQTHAVQKIFFPERVEAVGDLTINWGIGTGNVGPIFTLNNIAPGQSTQRTVTISNGSPTALPISIHGIKTDETKNLSNVMDIRIARNGTDLYGGTSVTGPKTLANFFSESTGLNGITLTTQNSNTTFSYDIYITFKDSANNSYQNASLTFDIKFGITVDIPVACQSIDFGGRQPIFGTKKSEKLNGTSQNDLILGMGGSDKIDGKGGQDCILGGDGSDSLVGDAGNDVIMGEGGADTIKAGDGNDIISAGAGADSMYGENGNDNLTGDAGSDKAVGGSGSDTCSAESKSQCEL